MVPRGLSKGPFAATSLTVHSVLNRICTQLAVQTVSNRLLQLQSSTSQSKTQVKTQVKTA